ncbi:MAG: exosortase/archaeosortase family protein [Sedimentisphaerales bacterium]|nr:exosortase/archaeosortase family protein [Sedimentisphaerales bacterium]
MVDNITSNVTETSEGNTLRRKQHWRDVDLHSYIKMLIVGGLIWWVFRDEIGTTVNRWLTDGSWSHGFLIPLFSLYFLNQNREKILNVRTKPNYIGLGLLVGFVAIHTLNKTSPAGYAYGQPLAAVAVIGAVVLFLGGWQLLKLIWLPVGFLAFAIPLPRRLYVSMTMPMRHLAANIAAALLRSVNGIETTVSGVVIAVVYKGKAMKPDLNVAEACSGMRLLMAFVALGVAMAYLHYRPMWQRFVLLASTIPIAILCNIVRVTVTGFIYVLIHPRYTQGIYHDTLGLMMLPLAFVLYGFLAWFMSGLFVEEGHTATEDIVVRRSNV